MQIVCTNCQAKIKVPDSAAGKRGKCPKCGTVLTIPAAVPSEAGVEGKNAPETGMMAEAPPPEVAGEEAAGGYSAAPPPLPSASSRNTYEDDRRPRQRDDDYDEGPRRRRDDDDEYDDEPRRRDRRDVDILRRPPSIGLSLTSMILGITAMVITLASTIAGGLFGLICPCGFIGGYIGIGLSGILALVSLPLGFVGLNKGGKGFAVTGLITSGLSVLLIVLYVILSLLGIGLFAAFIAANQQPPPR